MSDFYQYNENETDGSADTDTVAGTSTNDQTEYYETANGDDETVVGTYDSLSPSQQWLPTNVNSADEGTAVAHGDYYSEQTDSDPDGTPTVTDHVVQSYNYSYSGNMTESWDDQRNAVTLGGTFGNGKADGNQNWEDLNTASGSGQHYYSQTYAYTQNWSKQYPQGAVEMDAITENNNRVTRAIDIDPEGSVTTTTLSYATSDPTFDNDYYNQGLFPRNGPFEGSYNKGYWWSSVQAPLSTLAGYSESDQASGVTPTAFTPMGGISNTAPNIIQPTTNVTMPAPAGHGTAGSPANAGSFQYSDYQISNHWYTWGVDYTVALFHPSSFGTAESSVTMSPTLQKVTGGLQFTGILLISAGTFGIAAEAAATYLGADVAATWGGAFLTNAAGGAAGGFAQDGLNQLFSDQPINFKELGGAIISGALTGGLTGVAFKGLGAGYQLVKGLMSDTLTNVASDATSNASRDLRLPTKDGGLDPGVMGSTSPNGNVTLRSGLSREEQVLTLRHEAVHAFLSAKGTGRISLLRQSIGVGAYAFSQLAQYIEEAAAETYATGSLAKGLAFPISNGYVSLLGVLVEDSLYTTTIGTLSYLGYEWELHR